MAALRHVWCHQVGHTVGRMHRSWRRLLARLSEALPEARYEAVLALLRASVLIAGGLGLLVGAHGTDGLELPVVLNLVLGVASVCLAGAFARVKDVDAARRWGRWCTAADVLLYAAYSV